MQTGTKCFSKTKFQSPYATDLARNRGNRD